MKYRQLAKKLCRKVRNIFLKPIPVFCFHQVSDEYDPLYGVKETWTETEEFKRKITSLTNKYTFISISEAVCHLKKDVFRKRRYAVLTSDDGFKSVMNVLPWLEQKKIPITLFINVQYLDGVSCDPRFEERWVGLSSENKALVIHNMYIHWEQLWMDSFCSQNITLAIHGMGHDDVSVMQEDCFSSYVDKCVELLSKHTRYKPFFAYTWSRHTEINDKVLEIKGIIPVYCDGGENFSLDKGVHRIWIDGDRNDK